MLLLLFLLFEDIVFGFGFINGVIGIFNFWLINIKLGFVILFVFWIFEIVVLYFNVIVLSVFFFFIV